MQEIVGFGHKIEKILKTYVPIMITSDDQSMHEAAFSNDQWNMLISKYRQTIYY